MRRRKFFGRAIRMLTAGLCLAGATGFPFVGETASAANSQASDSVIVGNAPVGNRSSNIKINVVRPENGNVKTGNGEVKPAETVADRVWNRVNSGASTENVQNNMPQKEPVAVQNQGNVTQNITHSDPAPAVPANPVGYTEAEIRERMVRQYTPPKPVFRRVSGAAAGNDYKSGSMDVKIPNLFFPPDVMQEFSETFTENPDGTFGTRAQGDMYLAGSGYSAAAQRQLQEEQWRKAQEEQKRAAQAGGQKGISNPSAKQGRTGTPAAAKPKPNSQASAVKGKQKTKVITVQVPVPAPSPFRALSQGDFYWFNNTKGHYLATLPGSLSQDPLLQVPASGPMMIRSAGQSEFMAITVDDPSDSYYYKNQETFPSYGKVSPVFTETRKNIQGDDVAIKYIRRYVDGQHCLIVDSNGKRAGKAYRVAVVFPESKQHEYLPKALYAIENLKAT